MVRTAFTFVLALALCAFLNFVSVRKLFTPEPI